MASRGVLINQTYYGLVKLSWILNKPKQSKLNEGAIN
jgi:hypothetical protein